MHILFAELAETLHKDDVLLQQKALFCSPPSAARRGSFEGDTPRPGKGLRPPHSCLSCISGKPTSPGSLGGLWRLPVKLLLLIGNELGGGFDLDAKGVFAVNAKALDLWCLSLTVSVFPVI